jgi:hypothetical protein
VCKPPTNQRGAVLPAPAPDISLSRARTAHRASPDPCVAIGVIDPRLLFLCAIDASAAIFLA